MIKPYVDLDSVEFIDFEQGKAVDPNYFQTLFENELKLFINDHNKEVCAVNSGTSALHLAFRLIDFDEQDVVYVSDSTYIATISPLFYLKKGIPSFIDIDEKTGNMDLELLEYQIKEDLSNNKKPRAIVFTHNYGYPGDMSRLLTLKSKYQLLLIEDAAEALGSEYGNKKCGTFSDYGILSFNTNKICTTLGGGALIVNSEEEKNEVKKLSTHYKSKSDYFHEKLGYNYRMNDLAAFLGCYQIKRVSKELNRKKSIYNHYSDIASNSSFIELFHPNHEDRKHNYWLNYVRIKGLEKDRIIEIIDYMKAHGVEVRRPWVPLSSQPFLQRYSCARKNVKAERFYKSTLLLPSSISISKLEIKDTLSHLLRFENSF